MSQASSDQRGTTLLLLGIGLAVAALELWTGFLEPYELFHDELYYWSCSRRLGFGYVDHPPLSAWILAAATPVLGDGRLVFGLIPALCALGTVLLTGRMARSLGAARFGQLLAALCVATAPFHLVFYSFYSVNAFELLF